MGADSEFFSYSMCVSYWCPESLSSHEYVDDTEVSEEGHDEEHTEEESECIFDEGVLGRVFAPVLVNDRPELVGEVIQLGGPCVKTKTRN